MMKTKQNKQESETCFFCTGICHSGLRVQLSACTSLVTETVGLFCHHCFSLSDFCLLTRFAMSRKLRAKGKSRKLSTSFFFLFFLSIPSSAPVLVEDPPIFSPFARPPFLQELYAVSQIPTSFYKLKKNTDPLFPSSFSADGASFLSRVSCFRLRCLPPLLTF